MEYAGCEQLGEFFCGEVDGCSCCIVNGLYNCNTYEKSTDNPIDMRILTTVVGSRSAPHSDRNPAMPVSIDIKLNTTIDTTHLSIHCDIYRCCCLLPSMNNMQIIAIVINAIMDDCSVVQLSDSV
jgi:hypothetical protein